MYSAEGGRRKSLINIYRLLFVCVFVEKEKVGLIDSFHVMPRVVYNQKRKQHFAAAALKNDFIGSILNCRLYFLLFFFLLLLGWGLV